MILESNWLIRGLKKMRRIQQQLSRRDTCTPADTSLVRSTVVRDLNREETLSDSSLKTRDNSLEENRRSGKTGQNLRVSAVKHATSTAIKARGFLKTGFSCFSGCRIARTIWRIETFGKGLVFDTRHFLTALTDGVSKAQT